MATTITGPIGIEKVADLVDSLAQAYVRNFTPTRGQIGPITSRRVIHSEQQLKKQLMAYSSNLPVLREHVDELDRIALHASEAMQTVHTIVPWYSRHNDECVQSLSGVVIATNVINISRIKDLESGQLIGAARGEYVIDSRSALGSCYCVGSTTQKFSEEWNSYLSRHLKEAQDRINQHVSAAAFRIMHDLR